MAIPSLNPTVIHTKTIEKDINFQGLRIVRTQSDPLANNNFNNNGYEFQSATAEYVRLIATVSRKGFIGPKGQSRIVATIHPTLRKFTDLVRYDPSNPPPDDYNALGMKEMHDRTQSDFKGQKAQNKMDFRDYILEGIRGDRPLSLPTISGWQSETVFDKTVFVAFDESDPNVLYGYIYLPKSPVMQADGQTQTAALFAVAHSKDAIDTGALDQLIVTLDVELNVNERSAGQSFADRNGRGSKKNKNLVISLDTSSALSELRISAIEGTIFQDRLATGRNTSTSESATKYLVDLSTMEQMLLNVISEGRLKTEHFKRFHVDHFLPFAKDFVKMLENLFANDWLENTPNGNDPFRKVFVHGWPFALKAIALAYYEARINELGPLCKAINAKDTGLTVEEAYLAKVEQEKASWTEAPTISIDELRDRLSKIDWLRYRAHWIKLTGTKLDKSGKVRRQKLKSTGGIETAIGQAQNTATVINSVKNKILSPSWEELTKQDNY
ncbi:hypothetical protein RYR42_001932 [Edwardsiella piscicida]|uniref:hypothetical protein n=1 Tax=Enterobacterales TaxID=91347 RepID=UPI000E2F8533|nr:MULTISPECIES: hypothetical protein [Enterobacterales]EGQ5295947.1 hypothetical protein [Enterobacter cloacae]HDT3784432.1 hypothetical protein [Enterobacter hormaechei subsp. steigerwaltii]ELM3736463.1 hypothetical protein [Edwardsiella piscicida]WGS76717.1 hypothetical protein PED68_15565 [Edwardsiella piscicida]WGS80108.1 hypothetical protein PED70_15565 [Edwardsiella piscicida]